MNKFLYVSLGVIALSGCSQTVSEPVEAAHFTLIPKEKVQPTKINVPTLTSSESYKLAKDTEKSAGNMDTGLLSGQLLVSLKTGFTVSLMITNKQVFGVPIQYRSGMTADLYLLDPKGDKIWAWSDTMMFTQAIRDVTISPGQVIPVRFTLPKAVLVKVKGEGYSLEAIYAGQAIESTQVAMETVRLSLNEYLD